MSLVHAGGCTKSLLCITCLEFDGLAPCEFAMNGLLVNSLEVVGEASRTQSLFAHRNLHRERAR